MTTQPELLTTEAVSEWTGIPAETLRYWRQRGEGPAYTKLGRSIRYPRAEVQRWLDAQTARAAASLL